MWSQGNSREQIDCIDPDLMIQGAGQTEEDLLVSKNNEVSHSAPTISLSSFFFASFFFFFLFLSGLITKQWPVTK